MKKACEPYLEGVADLASGRENPAAQQHVEGCADCARQLSQLSLAVQSLAVSESDAPADLVHNAVSLMPKKQPLFARLTASTLQAAGVRAIQSAEAFQLRYEAGGVDVRLMYARDKDGWDIIGRVSESGWEILGPQGPVDLKSDRSFQFRVTRLEESEFEMIRGDTMIQIPNPMDEVDGAPGDR